MSKAPEHAAEYLLVMTSCIDPSAGRDREHRVHRNDPALRLEDYKRSLRYWLAHRDARLSRILFVDNSGYPLDALKEIAEAENPRAKRVEFISYDGNYYPPDVHYGYAELGILDKAYLESELLRGCSHLIKTTGRLYFPNLPALLDRLPAGCLFAVDCRDNRRFVQVPQVYATTQLMVVSKEFYGAHLLGAKAELGGEVTHMEGLIYRKILPFKGRPGAVLRWPVNVDPVGFAAHWQKDYRSARQRALSLARAVCRVVLPNWWV
jgi:hypothetical protein